ncbi:lysylphosphatidylglycerol synthase transmembrane domain-containing protein [Parachitinimonas caeni]|uniref:Lysylphosphatidylglycerol synthase transmembrane domain-containing protein n=1 Tax=Parachitinimonas caeni TaxID=3031301 RepID=A0ABT7DS82_9NEIS|nr:lysylphosphatidylglycerol synthase transmembrane domain-containing protein [Parachitinimonas caeni]MDK2122923.1 lysylphosphatidylglycerol synthase transmembrane domain-containing protein [Parachitinimonas caeni]
MTFVNTGQTTARPPTRQWVWLGGSILLAVLAYLAVVLWVGWAEVSRAILQVGAGGLLLAALMSCCNFGLRYLRWRRYLAHFQHRLPWLDGGLAYMAGFALTTTPLRAGETLRGLLLARFGVRFGQTVAIFVSERLADLMVVIALVSLGLAQFPQARPIVALCALLVAGVLISLLWPYWLQQLARRWAQGRIGRWLAHGVRLLQDARHCHGRGLLALSLLIGLLAWSVEGIAFQSILGGMGVSLSFTTVLLVYMIGKLAGVLSFAPGGLGGTEAAIALLLIWSGVPPAQAAAATILVRLVTLWLAVALGCTALALSLWREKQTS